MKKGTMEKNNYINYLPSILTKYLVGTFIFGETTLFNTNNIKKYYNNKKSISVAQIIYV